MKKRVLTLLLLMTLVFVEGYSKTYKSKSRSYSKPSSFSTTTYKKKKLDTSYKSNSVKATSTNSKSVFDEYKKEEKGSNYTTTNSSTETSSSGTSYREPSNSSGGFLNGFYIGRLFGYRRPVSSVGGSNSFSLGKLLFILFIIAVLIFAVVCKLDEKRSQTRKKPKDEDIDLPPKLDKGNYIEFDIDMFSNLSYDTKFLLNDTRCIVKDKEVFRVKGDNYRYVNLYLENQSEESIYLQLEMVGDSIKRSILYKNYDIIYPGVIGEWKEWLGSKKEIGIIGGPTFTVEDEVEEKLQDILYKLVKKLDKDTRAYENSSIALVGDRIETNLFNRYASGNKDRYEDILSSIKDDRYLSKCILGVEAIGNLDSLEIDREYIKNQCSVEYDTITEGLVESNSSKTSVVGSKYSRVVDGEFFSEEYLSADRVVDSERAYIRIDVGVEINLDLHVI